MAQQRRNMPTEVTGRWEEIVSQPELRGHRVRVTMLDEERADDTANGVTGNGDWVESLRRMAQNGVRVARPADDSRENAYE